MNNLALPRIQALQPYEPPLDGRSVFDGLLLDFNERTKAPASMPPLMSRPQLYPDYFDLTQQIAGYADVTAEQVMVTNGTDQAIDIICRTFADRDDEIVIPEPTFALYRQYALVNGSRVVSPRYGDGLQYPVREVLGALTDKTKLVVICNPNNPTGTAVRLPDIERIARAARGAIVYIDEAYFEFSGITAVGLIDRYPNIIVSRTFSKAFGLAGLRIGYIVARPLYIRELLKVRGPYDVNQIAAAAASAALGDTADMKSYVREVMTRSKPLVERFFEQSGIEYYPSAGNFILFRPADAERVASSLRNNAVLVRPQTKPGIQNTLRLTIGTADQMRRFIQIYRAKVLSPPQKYAMLDRDGTLLFEPPDTRQVDSLSKLRLLDGAITGLRLLKREGFRLVLVTNQDGLGTAAFPQAAFRRPQQAMMKRFAEAGITFERVFICPHLPRANCACRKPKTGLVDEWLRQVNVDTGQSFVCGDRSADRGLADNLGLQFVPMKTNGNFAEAITTYVRRNLT